MLQTNRIRLLASASGLVIAGAFLAGCTVSPAELTPAYLSAAADASLSAVDAGQEPVHGAIDLYEAIARSVKYNLDYQVEMAEQAIRDRELALAHYSMLPNVVASSGYAARDRFSASSSTNVLTGQTSLATSTSQDKQVRNADIAFGWNVVDFGLSYVRARQAGDKVLIQSELRRKIRLRIIEEVRGAYWRALSAQRLLGRLARVEEQARDVEREARLLAKDGQTSPITALTYQREIVDVQRVIGEVQRDLNTAHAQLGALMNLRPGTRYRVAEMPRRPPGAPAADMGQLVHLALTNRPELREVEYRKRINEQEAHAALLELLPGLNLIGGNNFDSNSFLLHSHWTNWGARAGWNLLKVFSYPARRAVVEEQQHTLEMRTLAVSMAVMTQVYVSRIRHAHALKEYDTAVRYRDVQSRLLSQIRAEASAERVARQTLVREELNAVVAEAKLDIAYAGVQSSLANMHSSLGLDLNDADASSSASVSEVAAAIKSYDGRLVQFASSGANHR
jgi:outer membrane protein TolC